MKKMILAAAIAASFVAAPVFAQGYVGLGLGSSSVSGFDRNDGFVAFTGGNASKTSTKLLGGYQITPNWGVEAQYTALGKRAITVTPVQNGANTNSANASQFGIYGTGTYPINASVVFHSV
jgi:OOP family OmpA-OmpF porin